MKLEKFQEKKKCNDGSFGSVKELDLKGSGGDRENGRETGRDRKGTFN